MQPLIIKGTNSTPEVLLDKEKGIFEISGISLPNDAIEFYQPISNWIESYLENPNANTTLVFELEYFNSASSKIFMGFMKLLSNSLQTGRDLKIEWRYLADDSDTLEAGKDYSSMISIPFTFTEIQPE
jgi:hypothetical protein